jgi:ABC-type dipeptide/oligopeptide/nickel transport system permease component
MDNFEWTLTIALGLVALTVIGGVVAGVIFSRRIRGEQDEDVSGTRIRHKVIANPIYWWYVFFVVAVIVGVYAIYTWTWIRL